MQMKLFQNCPKCGCSIRDRKLLQILEVYPIKCPSCGARVEPLRPEKSDIIVEWGEDDAVGEVATFEGRPANFRPNIVLNGGKNDNADND